MTTISTITPTQANPLLQRNPARAYTMYEDEVYDPVLDPAVNPALGDGLEEVQVTARQDKADDKLSFWDFLDIVNPLQHIPGVNAVYRELTGDTIKTPMKMIGAAILGGPVGFAAAMADTIIEESTGKDVAAHAMTMFSDKKSEVATAAPGVQMASVDAREFIPGDPAQPLSPAATTQVAQAAPIAIAPPAAPTITPSRAAQAYAARQTSAQRDAATRVSPNHQLPASVQQQMPAQQGQSEAGAIVQTAQIAAQANVFPSFKPTAPTRAPAARAPGAPAAQATADGYRALDRTTEHSLENAPRNNVDPTAPSRLRARTKFAPGSAMSGGATLSPASLAAVNASRNKAIAAARNEAAAPAPAAPAPAVPPSPQDAYAYGRQAATSSAPVEVPAWFDSAMLGAIDKYNAMQQVK